jgi:hypothetical protein
VSNHQHCVGLSGVIRGSALALPLVVLLGSGTSATAQPQPFPSIVLTKTVGTDLHVCATTDAITVPAGTQVVYCYGFAGSVVTPTLSDLVDSELGQIFQSTLITISPGAGMVFTRTALLNSTTVNTATWTATFPQSGFSATVSDIATVTVVPPLSPSIALRKTVGTDPASCAATDVITLVGGGNVTYCYTVENTGALTVSLQDLVDTHLGTIFSVPFYILAPGTSASFTQSAFLTQTTVNGAACTATDSITQTIIVTYTSPGFGVRALNGTGVVTATDFATATVLTAHPSIVLTKTVGTDPSVCAGSGLITVVNQPHADVYYCYQVLNTGDVTLSVHDLVDSQLGTLLSAFPYALPPGASTFLTQNATLTQTTANTATWTASLAGIASATAGGQAAVEFQYVNIPVLSRSGLALLLLVVAGAGLVLLRRYV